MNSDNSFQFEKNLVHKYTCNPNPELAEVLIKEYSAHQILHDKVSMELETWINDRASDALNHRLESCLIFGLSGRGGRPETELKYISMNSLCWCLLFKSIELDDTFDQVAKIFSTDPEKVKVGFYRKNHDFGMRELCRFGLDLSITINRKAVSIVEKNIILDILKEDVSDQMYKNLNHHRVCYRF